MAAMLEGKAAATLDMTGLAQKGGQVISHLKIAATAKAIDSVKVQAASADLLIGADVVAAASAEGLSVLGSTSHAVVNTEATVTGAFTANPDLLVPVAMMTEMIGAQARRNAVSPVAATALARRLLGDAIGANMILVGHAWQRGLIPLARESTEAAIRMNGAAVPMNLAAFAIGRIAAHDPARLEDERPAVAPVGQSLDDVIARRAAF